MNIDRIIKRRQKALKKARKRFAKLAKRLLKEREQSLALQNKIRYDELFNQAMDEFDKLVEINEGI